MSGFMIAGLAGLLLVPPTHVPPVEGFHRGVLRVEIARGGDRLARETVPAKQASAQQPKERNWVQRHPALFGAVAGFGVGFLAGYLPGDDGVFDDFTAGFNGNVLGGIGAAVGGLTGWIVGRGK